MARLKETPRKSQLAKIFDSGRKSLSPASSAESTMSSSSSSNKLKRGFQKVGLYPADRERTSTGSNASESAMASQGKEQEDLQDISATSPSDKSPDFTATSTSQLAELPAVALDVGNGSGDETTSIYLGNKTDNANKGHSEVTSNQAGEAGPPVPRPSHEAKAAPTGPTVPTDLPLTTDYSKPAVGHIEINGVKKPAYLRPQTARKENFVGNRRSGPFYMDHWLKPSTMVFGENAYYNAITCMRMKHPTVLKVGPVTLRNREVAHRVHQLVLGTYGFLIAYAAIQGPFTLFKCLWKMLVFAILYEIAIAALGWEERKKPDVLLLALEMMAKEVRPFIFDMDAGEVVGFAGYRWAPDWEADNNYYQH